MAKRTEDQWKLIKEGFIAGFINAHNIMADIEGRSYDGKATRKIAEGKAREHVRILKSSGK